MSRQRARLPNGSGSKRFDSPSPRTMPITYLIKFDVVPEQRDRFLGLLNGILDAMRSEPMFHQAILH